MKMKQSIVCLILIALTLVSMFIPFATFSDGRTATMKEDITKYTERRDSEVEKYNRYVDQGKAQKDLDKQYAKIEKQQKTVDEYIYELYAMYIDNRMTKNQQNLAEMDKASAEAKELQAKIDADKEILSVVKFDKEGRVEEMKDAQIAVFQPLYDQYLVEFFKIDTTGMDEAAIAETISQYKLERGNEALAPLYKELEQDAAHKITFALLPSQLPMLEVGPKEEAKPAEGEAEPVVAEVEGAAWDGLALNKSTIKANMAPDPDDPKKQMPIYPVTFDADNKDIIDNELTPLYVCIYTAVGMLLLTALFVALARGKLVSILYTFASFTNLIAILLLFYSFLRVGGLPIALPYADPVINWWVAGLTLVLAIAALFVNIKAVTNTKRTMIYVLCIFFSILSLLPFWLMIVNATRSSQAIQSGVSLIPSNFLGHNWTVLETKNFNIFTGFKNSAIIAFGSTILGVYFSALTAYGLSVYKFRGSKLMYAIVLAIIMIPGQVTGTGFFMFMYQINWTNSYLPLVIPAIAGASTVFFFKQYLEANFQVSLVEAARIDGAGEFYTYNRIIMPIMVPAMATMGIMAVIGSWNNYLTPLMLLSADSMKTLPMMVKELRGDIYRTEYGSIYLGLTLTALPLMIVYFCFSKFIIAGVAVGGVKE